MPEPELFLLFVRPLNGADIRYMVTGSVAAIFYGEPRLTHDVDFVAFLNEANIPRLPEIFPSADFYVPPPEVIAAEVQRYSAATSTLSTLKPGSKRTYIRRAG